MYYIQIANELCKLFKILIISKGREFWKVPNLLIDWQGLRRRGITVYGFSTVNEFSDSVNSHIVHGNLNLILILFVIDNLNLDPYIGKYIAM